jgi:hypothetical protein
LKDYFLVGLYLISDTSVASMAHKMIVNLISMSVEDDDDQQLCLDTELTAQRYRRLAAMHTYMICSAKKMTSTSSTDTAAVVFCAVLIAALH